MLTPFDAAKKLLGATESKNMKLRDRLDMFFVDFSLVGLLVQENYLKAVEKRNELEALNRCAYSADLMTVGDIMNTRITRTQDWSLLPDVGIASAVYPAFVTNGFVPFPSFPSFLGKYSTMSRMRRLTMELQAHLRLSSTMTRRDLLTSGYSELLYKKLMTPLMQGDPKQSVNLLDTYGLQKDHLTEHLTELRTHLGQEDLFKMVDSKVKSAMTREFNSGGHAMKVVLPKSKRRKVEASGMGNPDEEDDAVAEEVVESDKSDDGDAGGLVKIKGKAKGKAKAKAKAKSGAAPAADGASPSAPKAKGRGRGKAKSKA